MFNFVSEDSNPPVLKTWMDNEESFDKDVWGNYLNTYLKNVFDDWSSGDMIFLEFTAVKNGDEDPTLDINWVSIDFEYVTAGNPCWSKCLPIEHQCDLPNAAKYQIKHPVWSYNVTKKT